MQQVLALARSYARGPLPTATTAAASVAALGDACAAAATGPTQLAGAVTLARPRRFAVLPRWAMAGGRAPEQIDARILADLLWILRTYGLRVTAAREVGHNTHGDGTAADMVPAAGAGRRAWDRSALRLAHDIGWTQRCAASGVAPACPLAPWVRFVGYNGYPAHGDPAHAGPMAHIHVSWLASHYGASALTSPNAWVRAFAIA